MKHILQFSFNRKKKHKKNRVKRLEQCPQKKGTCLKVATVNPKKPNSANRCIAFLKLTTKKLVRAYVMGEKQVDVKTHSKVLIRGGRVRDLPGVKFKIIRGVLDCKSLLARKTSRSKYGVKKPE
jgi:small subunit ribosomal protein S12